MIWMRIKPTREDRRLEIVDSAHQQWIAPRHNGEHKTAVRRMPRIIDPGQKPANLVRIQQRPFVDSFSPARCG